jgi:hypothetical protein
MAAALVLSPVGRSAAAQQATPAPAATATPNANIIIPGAQGTVTGTINFSPTCNLVCDQIGNVSQTSTGNVASEVRLDRPPLKRTPIDRETVQAVLEAILVSDELPPPSLREIAARIGQTYHCGSVPAAARVVGLASRLLPVKYPAKPPAPAIWGMTH